jgi:uncharacterized protein (TIGR02246 family)
MTTSDTQAEITSLVARLLEALQRHDAVACAALFSEDGLILSPYGPPARGRNEIQVMHQGWFDEGETNKRLTVLETRTSGDLGYCLLAYAGDYLQFDGTCSTHRGRSLSILQRMPNSEWRIRLQGLIADL